MTAALLFFGFFLAMLASAEIGRHIGLARLAREQELTRGSGAAEAAMFGLLGLMIAFTFAGASTRLDARKLLIGQEANAIGTAWLRIDLLPAETQPEIREMFRRYLDARMATYRNVRDEVTTRARLEESAALQASIWDASMAAGSRPDARTQALMLVVPALNAMFDITTDRVMATRNHAPTAVFVLLAALCLLSALLVGYDTSPNRERSWFHNVVFSAILTLTAYIIIDLEFPRVGLIRVDGSEQILSELRASMD